MAGPPVVPSTTAANTTAPTPTTDDHVAAAATVVRQFLDFDTATGLMASDDLINDSNNNDDDDHNDVVVVSENRVASPAMVTTTKLSHSKQLEDMGGAGMAAPVAAPLLPVDMARASMGDALADPNGIAAAPTESASEVVSVKQQLRKLLPRPKVDVSVEVGRGCVDECV